MTGAAPIANLTATLDRLGLQGNTQARSARETATGNKT